MPMPAWTILRLLRLIIPFILAASLSLLSGWTPLSRAELALNPGQWGGQPIDSQPVDGAVPATEPLNSGHILLDQITALNKDINGKMERLDAVGQPATGTSAAVRTALSILAAGLTSHLLHTALHPEFQPLDHYQTIINNRYIQAALQSLIHTLIPSILGGAWIGVIVESGQTPALPIEETAVPLLTGTATLQLASLGYTWLSFAVSRYLGNHTEGFLGTMFRHTPATVVLVNSAVVLTALTIWLLRERMNKQYTYTQLQLQLASLRRRLAALRFRHMNDGEADRCGNDGEGL